MANISRSMKLVRKSEAAMISAIEVYNKPDFKYREETFAILMLNAWELLLKGKFVAANGNHVRCLYVYEKRQTRKGTLSRKLYLRKNRTGNTHTIGLGRVIAELENKTSIRVPVEVKANLDALTEIRDNAVHYLNASHQLAKQILEIGTASVKNFIDLTKIWFGYDLSKYNLYLMPIAFVSSPQATALSLSPDEENLVSYLARLVRDSQNEESTDFHVSLAVNLSFTRSSEDAVALVGVTDDPTAPKVHLTEEDIRKAYPWDYAELTKRLKTLYLDFKLNQKFYDIKKPLMQDSRYVKSRYLDPGNPNSAKKNFYNPNIIGEFDRHYTRRIARGTSKKRRMRRRR